MPTTRRLAAACCTALLLPLLQIGEAGAAPTKAGYKAEVERLGTQISQIDEDYNYARIRLSQLERQVRDTEQGKKEADQRLQTLRKAASARASAVYRVGFPGLFLILFGSNDSSEFSRKMGVASRVGTWESTLMSDLQVAKGRSDEKTQELKTALAKQRVIGETLADNRAALRSRINQQQALLARFEADQAAAARRRTAATAPRTSGPTLITPPLATPKGQVPRVVPPELLPSKAVPVAPPPKVSGSGVGAKVVEYSYGFKGRPYRWAASGPDAFDCSGFTSYVWRHVGVSLPHSSRAQFAAAPRVERANLQPGDLVFFGSPIHHVGMFIGGTSMIDAPSTGGFVGIRSMARSDYVGAVRPG